MRNGIGEDLQTLIRSEKDGKRKVDTYIVYKSAVKSALFDGVITRDETNMLNGLANTLDLSTREKDIIIKEAKRELSVEIIKQIQKEEKPPEEMTEDQRDIRRLNIENEALRLEIACLRAQLKDQEDVDHTLEEDIQYLKGRISHLEEINTELEEMLEVDKEKMSDLAHNGTKSPMLKKTVICNNCKAERVVEVIYGCPMILTCSSCGQKYLVSAE